ncbi:MAG: class F sortase [Caldilineaceae bacterium]
MNKPALLALLLAALLWIGQQRPHQLLAAGVTPVVTPQLQATLTAIAATPTRTAPVSTTNMQSQWIKHVVVGPLPSSTITPTTIPPAATTALTVAATAPPTMSYSSTFTTTPTLNTNGVITVARPVRLLISTLNIDAAIEAVGQDRQGAMGIPRQVDNVAWYAPGAAPGEIGNAVLAGHLDRANGAPAVFWSLGKLQPGNAVVVIDAAGVAYHFQVTGQQRYDYDHAPLEEIFGFALHSRLNLITCAGEWDRNHHNYTNRLVVYTELVKIIPPTS